jgi:NitT/TauT family transport system substrate-binding protein
VTLREKGVPAADISVLLMADYGLALYGNVLFVHPKVAAEKPEELKGFLRAVTRALKETIRDPAAAAAAVIRRNGGGNRDLEMERLTIALRDSIVTPEVRAQGLGGIDQARFETALGQLAVGYTFKGKPKLEDVFDASFLPAEDERRLD